MYDCSLLHYNSTSISYTVNGCTTIIALSNNFNRGIKRNKTGETVCTTSFPRLMHNNN